MELYDPEFPCDSDLTDVQNSNVNGVSDVSDVGTAQQTHAESAKILQKSDETPMKGNANILMDNTKACGVSKGENMLSISKSLDDKHHHQEKSFFNFGVGSSMNKSDEAEGDDVLEDDATYRNELKKLSTPSRHVQEFELKPAKDVPLEMYLGPSVGFRVDLTMSKSRKMNIESIARRRHELNDRQELFEQLSPEQQSKSSESKNDTEDNKTTTKNLILEKVNVHKETGSQQKTMLRDEQHLLIESENESDNNSNNCWSKKEARKQMTKQGVSRTDDKFEENCSAILHDLNTEDSHWMSKRQEEDHSSKPNRSKSKHHDLVQESNFLDRKDSHLLRKSDAKESHHNEKDSKQSSKKKQDIRSKEKCSSRQLSEERLRPSGENRESLCRVNKIREKDLDKDRQCGSDTDSDLIKRKQRGCRSTSTDHKKRRKSRSKSHKRRRDRSKSSSHCQFHDSHSKSREHERRHEKKSVDTSRNSRHEEHQHSTPLQIQKTYHDRRRRHRSRSKSPSKQFELSKKRPRLSHPDATCPEEKWAFAERNSRGERNKVKQPSLKELHGKSTSLLEACMKTRYENRFPNSNFQQSSGRRGKNYHKDSEYAGHSFSRTSGKQGSIDYITLSDSDEGIVWSDNDEQYTGYNDVMTKDEPRKQKYEDIYASRGHPDSSRNRISSRLPQNVRSRQERETSLLQSEIIAINLKEENSQKIEKLKITKSVSQSSLEPGEIDEGSSICLSDNGIIEDTLPVLRKVRLVNEEDGSCKSGEKVPIQIHVITSHGDSPCKVSERYSVGHEEVTTNVTTIAVTEGNRAMQNEEKILSRKHCQDEPTSVDGQLSLDNEMTICSSPFGLEQSNKLAAGVDTMLSQFEEGILDNVEYDGASHTQKRSSLSGDATEGVQENKVEGSLQLSHELSSSSCDLSFKDSCDDKNKEDFEFNSKTEGPVTINPTISDSLKSFLSHTFQPEGGLPPASGRIMVSGQTPLYHIQRRSQSEQSTANPDLNSELSANTSYRLHRASPQKTILQLEEEQLQGQPTCFKSPVIDSRGAANQASPSVSSNLQSLLKTLMPMGFASVDGASVAFTEGANEPSQPSVIDCLPNKNLVSNSTYAAFPLNQNALGNWLASLPSVSASSLFVPSSSVTTASHEELMPLSKLLAAINPVLTTALAGSANTSTQAQKLIEDPVKHSLTSHSFSVDASCVKSGSSDDRLTNILNLQKKLLDLTRMSNSALQVPPPISQKLVQDIFKAVLLPTTSVSSNLSNLCPPVSDLPGSLSDENSMSKMSPFNADAASPLSGEIMSFSPPSLPDMSSPAKETPENKQSTSTKSTHKSKGSSQNPKGKSRKPTKSKLEEEGKDKKSKAEIQKLVIEEVKTTIKPFYSKGRINKDEYKEILRKTVPKICHSKTQDFSKTRITIYVEAYVRKVMATRKYNAKKKDDN